MNLQKTMIKFIVLALFILGIIFIKQLILFSDPKTEAESDAILEQVEEALIKKIVS